MVCNNRRCLGNYDFNRIAFFAHKRFIEGHNTTDLIDQAGSEREKEEIALVALLDLKDEEIQDLQLVCRHAGQCEVINCREKLRGLLAARLRKQ